jgi:hypothetical protein
MKIKTKIAIFLAAILLSLFGFNLITCSQCLMDMLNTGKHAGYTVTVQVVSVAPDMRAAP